MKRRDCKRRVGKLNLEQAATLRYDYDYAMRGCPSERKKNQLSRKKESSIHYELMKNEVLI